MPPQATAEAKRRSTGHRPQRPPHKRNAAKAQATGRRRCRHRRHRPQAKRNERRHRPQATGETLQTFSPPFSFCACFPQATATDAAKAQATGRRRCRTPYKRRTLKRVWVYCASIRAYKRKMLKREFDVDRKVLLNAKLTWTEFSMWNGIRVIQNLGRYRNGVTRLSSCICEMQCVTILLANGVGRLILYAAWVNSTDGQTIWAIMDGLNVPSVALPGRTTT